MANTISSLVIRVTSKSVKSASDRLLALGSAAELTEGALRGLNTQATKSDSIFRAFNDTLKGPVGRLKKISTSARSLGTAFERIATGATSANAALSGVSSKVGQAGTATAKLAGASKQATQKLKEEKRASRDAAAALKKLESSSKKASGAQRQLGRNVSLTTRGIKGIIQRSIAAASAFIALQKAIEGVKFAFRTTADLERINVQLKFVAGSTQEAAETMGFLSREAKRTGQELVSSAGQFTRLSFAMQQAGLSARDAEELFKAVGNASATFALDAQEVNSVLLAFTQVASKGKLQAEEIRKQIGERLPGAFGLAATSIGKTTAELSAMLDAGLAPAAKDFLPAFTREMNRAFGRDIAEKTNTITAATSRLRTEIQLLVQDLGLTDFFRNYIQGLTAIVGWFRAYEGEKLGESLVDSLERLNSLEDNFSPQLWLGMETGEDRAKKVSKAVDEITASLKDVSQAQLLGARAFIQANASEIDGYERLLFQIDKQSKANREAAALREANAKSDRDALAASEALVKNRGEAIKLNKEVVESYQSVTKGLETPMESLYRKFRENQDAITAYYLSNGEVMSQAMLTDLERNKRMYDADVEAFKDAQDKKATKESLLGDFTDLEETLDPLKAIDREFERNSQLIKGYYEEAGMEVDDAYTDLFAKLKEKYDTDVDDYLESLKEKEDAAITSADLVEKGMQRIGSGIADGLANAAAEGKLAFEDLSRFVIAEIQKMLIKWLLFKTFTGIGGMIGGDIGTGFTNLGKGVMGNADGGYVPSGRLSMVGEEGPELISGPAVVTSTKTTADRMDSQRVGKGGKSSPTFIINMPGATMEAVSEVRKMVMQLNGSIESRAIDIVNQTYKRDGSFMRR